MRKPRKSPIKTRELIPLGNEVELTIYDDYTGESFSFPLEIWQIEAIQQLLGLEVREPGRITMFGEKTVKERMVKIGKWARVVEDDD